LKDNDHTCYPRGVGENNLLRIEAAGSGKEYVSWGPKECSLRTSIDGSCISEEWGVKETGYPKCQPYGGGGGDGDGGGGGGCSLTCFEHPTLDESSNECVYRDCKGRKACPFAIFIFYFIFFFLMNNLLCVCVAVVVLFEGLNFV
jgi:hypothetical protein